MRGVDPLTIGEIFCVSFLIGDGLNSNPYLVLKF